MIINRWIMERKRSSGFRRIFKVTFLLFPAPAGQSLTFTQPYITYQKLLWKYDETHNSVSFHDPNEITEGYDNWKIKEKVINHIHPSILLNLMVRLILLGSPPPQGQCLNSDHASLTCCFYRILKGHIIKNTYY